MTYLKCRAATNFSSSFGSYDGVRKWTKEGSAMMLQSVSSDHMLFTRSVVEDYSMMQ